MTNDTHAQDENANNDDEMNGDVNDVGTTSAHEIEESVSADDATKEPSTDTVEFDRPSPPSFAPHATGSDDDDDNDNDIGDNDADDDSEDSEGYKSALAKHKDGDDHPDHEDHDELRRSTERRHRLPWLTIVIGVLVLCAAFGYLYANGNINGTPRAQAMSSCQTEAAKASEAKRLADMAISSAKSYIDDPKTTIDSTDLRRLNVLMDDAGKEPAIPACTITTRDNDLKAHAKTSKELHDVYITIAKELLAITGGTIDGLDAASSTETTTPEPTATVTEEPAVTPTPTATEESSPTPAPSASASSSASPSPSATSSPSSPSSPSASSSSSASSSPSSDASTDQSTTSHTKSQSAGQSNAKSDAASTADR